MYSGDQWLCVVTKLNCSPQCDDRCYGTQANQCCHPECAAGCDGPTKNDCWVCFVHLFTDENLTDSSFVLVVFIVPHYASVAYAMAFVPVRLSVHHRSVGVRSKQLNISSRNTRTLGTLVPVWRQTS